MKKSFTLSFTLIVLLSALIAFGCKKDDSNKKPIDTTPKVIEIVFTNDNIQSHAAYSLNEYPHPGIALNGSDVSSKSRVQVKIGDILSTSMFTTLNVTSNYSVAIVYNDNQLASSKEVVVVNGNNRINLTHTFTEEDFK